MVMERTVRDLLAKQEDGEEALVKLVQQGNEEFTTLVARSRREQQDRESRLREQLQEALSKIRGYTRDMEEQLDRERLGLEEVSGARHPMEPPWLLPLSRFMDHRRGEQPRLLQEQLPDSPCLQHQHPVSSIHKSVVDLHCIGAQSS